MGSLPENKALREVALPLACLLLSSVYIIISNHTQLLALYLHDLPIQIAQLFA